MGEMADDFSPASRGHPMTRDEIKQAAEIEIAVNDPGDRSVYFARALLAYMDREEKNIDVVRFGDHPPCYLCGYNGPGYFQPDKHKCAAYYHAAIKAAEEGKG